MARLVFPFEIEHHAIALELAGISSFAVDSFQLPGSAYNGPASVLADGLAVVDDLLTQNAVTELVAAGRGFGDVTMHAGMVAADFLGDRRLVVLCLGAGDAEGFGPMALSLAHDKEMVGMVAEPHHVNLLRC